MIAADLKDTFRPAAPETIAAPLVIFAGGGSGGHLFPALAIASALRILVPAVRFTFFGTDRAIDQDVLSAAGETVVRQRVRPFSANPLRWPGFLSAWRASTHACREFYLAHRPAVVVGAGGFASGPAVAQAAAMGIPTAILNPDTLPGRANRFLARKVDAVFAQWTESERHFDNLVNLSVVGCPIRQAFRSADRQAGLQSFGLDAQRRTLLVTGASLGARSINRVMIMLADQLASLRDWQVLHLTGTEDLAAVRSAYDAAGVQAVCLAFTDRMPDALAACDLVVARAGASTLAEITAMGRPSILLPYPHHRDRHQTANARVLVSRGAARICLDRSDAAETARRLQTVLMPLTGDGRQLERMADRARRLGRVSAADEIARQLVGLARGRLVNEQ